jgi:prepilin-type N-terminal cleavage/methylation domain-containing protein
MNQPYSTRKAFSLPELLIAIFIVGVIMQGFTLLFIRSWNTNKFILETGLASSMAQQANNSIVVDLRGVQQADNGSFPIAEATPMSLTVYFDTDNNGTVERVHYYLDQASDELRKGITESVKVNGAVTYPAGDSQTRVLGRYVVNEANDPVFYYYNDNYPGDTTNNPLASPVSPGAVQLVRVKLLVNIDPIKAPNNIYIESFVDLRNMHNYDAI